MEPDTAPAQEKKEQTPQNAPASKSAEQETKPTQQSKAEGSDKPTIAYRIEPSRTFEINKEHSERPARARALAVLRSSLFGRKRYQEIILNCSLNNLFNALRIAQFLHLRVPNLSLTVRFVPVRIIEVFSDGNSRESHQITDKKKVEIKLTTNPTPQDQAEPGFNPGLPREQIEDPIEGLNLRNNGQKPERRRRNEDNKREGDREGRKDRPKKPRENKRERQDRGEGRGEGQGEGRGPRRNESRRDDRDRREKPGYHDERNKRDEEARRNRNKDRQEENRNYRRANYEQPEDDDFRRDEPRNNRRDDRNDRREEHRTETKKTRGGQHNRSTGDRERVQHQHNYDSRHLIRDTYDD